MNIIDPNEIEIGQTIYQITAFGQFDIIEIEVKNITIYTDWNTSVVSKINEHQIDLDYLYFKTKEEAIKKCVELLTDQYNRDIKRVKAL